MLCNIFNLFSGHLYNLVALLQYLYFKGEKKSVEVGLVFRNTGTRSQLGTFFNFLFFLEMERG